MRVIEVKDLVKRYGCCVAVDNVNLSIDEVEIFGLLGPNGAGKSTLISVITSLLNSNSGTVEIFGSNIKKDLKKVKKEIGLVPQSIAVYKNFTAYENVKLFGELYGLRGKILKENIEEALEFVGLLEHKNKKVEEYSGGMQRRLNIACAIVHKPKLIIMDEPTVGIDPQSRNHILAAVKKLNKNGTTVIYTTHYMEEVETLCSKIAIMDKGKIIVEGTKEELKNMINDKKSLSIRVDDLYKVNIDKVKGIDGVINILANENDLTINTKKEVNNLDLIIKALNEDDVKILDLGFKEITLETVFLSLTGRTLRD